MIQFTVSAMKVIIPAVLIMTITSLFSTAWAKGAGYYKDAGNLDISGDLLLPNGTPLNGATLDTAAGLSAVFEGINDNNKYTATWLIDGVIYRGNDTKTPRTLTETGALPTDGSEFSGAGNYTNNTFQLAAGSHQLKMMLESDRSGKTITTISATFSIAADMTSNSDTTATDTNGDPAGTTDTTATDTASDPVTNETAATDTSSDPAGTMDTASDPGTTSTEPSVTNGTADTQLPVNYFITASWEIPTQRTNGSPLPLSEIAGYELYYYQEGSPADSGTVISVPAIKNGLYITNYEIELTEPGSYAFAISTVDNNNLLSDLSDPIVVEIQ